VQTYGPCRPAHALACSTRPARPSSSGFGPGARRRVRDGAAPPPSRTFRGRTHYLVPWRGPRRLDSRLVRAGGAPGKLPRPHCRVRGRSPGVAAAPPGSPRGRSRRLLPLRLSGPTPTAGVTPASTGLGGGPPPGPLERVTTVLYCHGGRWEGWELGRVARPTSRGPFLHVVCYRRLFAAFTGNVDSLLDHASYGIRWVRLQQAENQLALEAFTTVIVLIRWARCTRLAGITQLVTNGTIASCRSVLGVGQLLQAGVASGNTCTSTPKKGM